MSNMKPAAKWILLAVAILSIAAVSYNKYTNRAIWPKPNVSREDALELEERYNGTSGVFHDGSYISYFQNYTSDGDYLNYGKWKDYHNDGLIFMHESGLPQVINGTSLYWNAVTLSHYALMMHGRYLRGDAESLGKFYQAADKLVELQTSNGAFPYPPMPHRHNSLPDGWVSAMAQGNALSVFARALKLSGEEKYRVAGDLSYQNLMTSVKDGGSLSDMGDLDPSLKDFIFFPEYPNTPVDYTLNGYMFTLLGIYDWSKSQSKLSSEAADTYEKGLNTLINILPLYDVDGFSTYDLAHIVLKTKPYVAPEYLGIHVHLLHAINSISPTETTEHYEKVWRKKIDEMNSNLRITSMSLSSSSPQPLGSTVNIKLNSSGGDAGDDTLYRVYVKYNGEWSALSEFVNSKEFIWTPKNKGDYILGFYAKSPNSSREWDSFRYQPFTVN
ncbi:MULTISPECIES: D-glucuronyl C5-epimerase family protein [Pseudomonas]|uniref:D-glucuronyl C5-epimerase family protein n=1 Tax=Pseudomonas TaxID=286 RepID=UPI0009F539B8|nr:MULTISPECIES: D-glucuronyl C5-epimerase family protein [Pseudomonas]